MAEQGKHSTIKCQIIEARLCDAKEIGGGRYCVSLSVSFKFTHDQTASVHVGKVGVTALEISGRQTLLRIEMVLKEKDEFIFPNRPWAVSETFSFTTNQVEEPAVLEGDAIKLFREGELRPVIEIDGSQWLPSVVFSDGFVIDR